MQVSDKQYSINQYGIQEVRLRLKDGETVYGREPMDSPDAAVKAMSELMSSFAREVVVAVMVDTRLKPICFAIINAGSLNNSSVDIPTLYRTALLSNASDMILLHNHPSGSISPSEADVSVTKRIAAAGNLMGIKLLDHIIVAGGTGDYFSFKTEKRLKSTNGIVSVSENKTEYSAADKEKYKEKYQEQMKEITEKLEAGVKGIFASDKYKEYLKTMSKFHNYSFRNSLLISLQKPDATYVSGYDNWQRSFKRNVKKGEKAIKIFSPAPYKITTDDPVINPETNQPRIKSDGTPVTEKREHIMPALKIASVFDISQTEGKELPELAHKLEGTVENYNDMITALQMVSKYPIYVQKMSGDTANGYFSKISNEIIIKESLSQEQAIKTMIHEISHSILHAENTDDAPDRQTKEVQAESVAYAVCQHFGIDSSDYSFGYIAGWSSGKDVKELEKSMEIIRKNAADIINRTEEHLQELQTSHQNLYIDLLAADISSFTERLDRAQHDKSVSERAAYVKGITDDIKSGNISDLQTNVTRIADEFGAAEDITKAKELYTELDKYKKEIPAPTDISKQTHPRAR